MNNTNEQIKEQPWNYKYQLNRTDWTHEWNKTIYESLHLKQQCSASHTIDPFRCDCTWEFSIAGRYLFAFILSPPNAIRMVIHVAHNSDVIHERSTIHITKRSPEFIIIIIIIVVAVGVVVVVVNNNYSISTAHSSRECKFRRFSLASGLAIRPHKRTSLHTNAVSATAVAAMIWIYVIKSKTNESKFKASSPKTQPMHTHAH